MTSANDGRQLVGTDPVCAHPLAYLLGVEGVALLRAFAGEYDSAFVDARLSEIRGLLDMAEVLGPGALVPPMSTASGYDGWAASYDKPGNAMVEREQVIVHGLLDDLSTRIDDGIALDAACGTGRHAEYLASLGFRVIGVDTSPGMLAIAREKLPMAQFHQAELTKLPLQDASVDVVVCGLALVHVENLEPVLAEFSRVLRTGGHLIVSDSRALTPGGRAFPLIGSTADGSVGYLPGWVHSTSEYLSAALSVGLRPLRCEEFLQREDLVDETGTPPGDNEPAEPYVAADGVPDIWSLHPYAPAATNAMFRDKPSFIVWHFRLDDA